MSTCSTWPHCIGDGRYCYDVCPPALDGTDKEQLTVEQQREAEQAAWHPNEEVAT